jgi:hypothetical protein
MQELGMALPRFRLPRLGGGEVSSGDFTDAPVDRGQFDAAVRAIPCLSRARTCAPRAMRLAGQTPSSDQRASIGCNIKWKPGNEPACWTR